MYSIPDALRPMFPGQFGKVAFASALTLLCLAGHASPSFGDAVPDLPSLDREAAVAVAAYAALPSRPAAARGDAALCLAALRLSGRVGPDHAGVAALLDAVHGLGPVPAGALRQPGDLGPVTFPTALDLGGGLRWADLDEVPRALMAGDLSMTSVGVLALADVRAGPLGSTRTHHALVNGHDEVPAVLAVASVARYGVDGGRPTLVVGARGSDPYAKHADAVAMLAGRLGVPLPPATWPGRDALG